MVAKELRKHPLLLLALLLLPLAPAVKAQKTKPEGPKLGSLFGISQPAVKVDSEKEKEKKEAPRAGQPVTQKGFHSIARIRRSVGSKRTQSGKAYCP